MTYTHLTTNELVMIEAYYQAGKKVCDIAKSLGRSRQTIYNVLSFLKLVIRLMTIMSVTKLIRSVVDGKILTSQNQYKTLSNCI